jgi:hypothetical protein
MMADAQTVGWCVECPEAKAAKCLFVTPINLGKQDAEAIAVVFSRKSPEWLFEIWEMKNENGPWVHVRVIAHARNGTVTTVARNRSAA